MTTVVKQVARIQKLRRLLVKNRNAYYRAIENNRECSTRMYGWIDEYNEFRGTKAWNIVCALEGSDVRHDAGDLFA